MTMEEARLTLPGNISCTTLIHKGRVEVAKNPARINKIIDILRGILNIKKKRGIEIDSPAWITAVLFLILSE
ncbi:unnamed protein product [marine sediment metagenome]|uniref:Uncharacterized protein n=1 Tax=marine sediment metagenome TaxID=412755 RepID=X1EKX6_9ZZZZ